MGLARGEPFIRPRALGELGEEVGEGRGKGKCTLPFKCVLGELRVVRIGRPDILVARVEGRDSNGATPEDEVLSILADLSCGENIALAYLMEAAKLMLALGSNNGGVCGHGFDGDLHIRHCWFGESHKLDHRSGCWIWVSLKL